MDISIIKNLLRERGMTFQQLSDKMGVDRTNLYNSLSKGNPTLSRLTAISEILAVPLWRLFTESDKCEVEIFGAITYKGKVYKIDSVPAYKALLNKMEDK